MAKIETPRLWLRPLALTDLDDLAEIYSAPEVMRYRLISQPASRKQTQESLESYLAHWEQHGFGRWATIHKASQGLIGHCGLEYLSDLDEVEVNYLLAREYWGRDWQPSPRWRFFATALKPCNFNDWWHWLCQKTLRHIK